MDADSHNDGIVYIDRAHTLAEMGYYEEAMACCKMAIKKDAGSIKAHMSKGDVFSEQQMHKEAVQCYDEAIKLGFEQENSSAGGQDHRAYCGQGILAGSAWAV